MVYEIKPVLSVWRILLPKTCWKSAKVIDAVMLYILVAMLSCVVDVQSAYGAQQGNALCAGQRCRNGQQSSNLGDGRSLMVPE